MRLSALGMSAGDRDPGYLIAEFFDRVDEGADVAGDVFEQVDCAFGFPGGGNGRHGIGRVRG